MTAPLLLERRDGGAHVTFNRPEARNAISRQMLADLADFLSEIQSEKDIRYLIFRGVGEHFSAGGDVGGFEESLALAPEARRRAYERRLIGNSDPFLLLSRLTVPVIAATRGAIAGAGLAFVLVSDFCFASADSTFVFAHAQLGLPIDLSLSYYLPRVVGWRKAKFLTLSSARLDAERAAALGIVDEVLPSETLDERVAEMIASLVAGPHEALRLSKMLLSESLDNDLPTQLEREARAVGHAVTHENFVEGVSAFLERRKPQFGG